MDNSEYDMGRLSDSVSNLSIYDPDSDIYRGNKKLNWKEIGGRHLKAKEKIQILMDSIDREIAFPQEQRTTVYGAIVNGLLRIAQSENDKKSQQFSLEPLLEGFGYWINWQQVNGLDYGKATLAAGRDGRHLKILKKQTKRELCLIYPGCYIAEAEYDAGKENVTVYRVEQIVERGGRFWADCERVYIKGIGGLFCTLEDKEFEKIGELIEAVAGLAFLGRAVGWTL